MPTLAALLLVLVITSAAASAQSAAPEGSGAAPASQKDEPQTREEALRQQRAEKAKQLRPNEPDKVQRGMAALENNGLFLIARDGFHPKIGTLTTGSGLAVGVGFRNRSIFDRRGTLELWSAVSLRKYWATEARAFWPDLARGRLMAEVVAGLREYPREDFFGLGPDTLKSDNTSFLLRTGRAGGRAGVRPVAGLTLGGTFDYLDTHTGRGRDNSVPSIEQRFDETAVPGIGIDTAFLKSGGFVEVDYRRPRNAREGGWYRFELSRYSDRSDGRFSFNRADLDVRQFFGFLAGRRVIALRGAVATSEPAGGAEAVPFFLMPSLGGHDSLRGRTRYRYRGPHSILLQAEYRWEIWSGLEGAFFYDAGKVAMRRSDLNLRKLQDDYGIGFRFNTDNGVVFRVDLAYGHKEGKNLYIVFGGTF